MSEEVKKKLQLDKNDSFNLLKDAAANNRGELPSTPASCGEKMRASPQGDVLM